MKTARVTATGAVLTGEYLTYGFLLAAKADNATATFYDAASATGTPIAALSALAGTTAVFPFRQQIGTGVWAVVTGTTPEVYASY